MRRFLISILLASAAATTPALADPDHDNGRWHQQQGEKQQAHQERQQGDRGQAHADRPAPPQVQMRQQMQVQGDQRGFEGPRFERVQNVPPQQVVEPQQQAFERRERGNWVRNPYAGQDVQQVEQSRQHWSGQRGDWNGQRDLRQGERPVPNVMRNPHPLVVSPVPREGTQPPLREEARRSVVQWNTDWRRDNRYDWRHWREHHHSFFHLGFYYDPFGWGYRPYEIGWRLWPAYYESNYWINDPWDYQLPPPPPGTVWVRYWNDALLVDTWSGEVIDVIHGFFW